MKKLAEEEQEEEKGILTYLHKEHCKYEDWPNPTSKKKTDKMNCTYSHNVINYYTYCTIIQIYKSRAQTTSHAHSGRLVDQMEFVC